MKSTHVRTGAGFRRVCMAALMARAGVVPAMGQSPARKGTIEHIKVRGAALGVPHVRETYEGDHTNKVVERIEQKGLPFFSENPAFMAPHK